MWQRLSAVVYMNIKLRFSVLFAFILASAPLAAEQEIIIGADIWCPYNCAPENKDKPGFMVELAQIIFARHGIKVRYEVMPWSRAKIQVSLNKIQGLIAGTPSNTQDQQPPLIFSQQEQARMQNSFFTLKGSRWQYQGVASLANINLGVIQGYDYGPLIQLHVNTSKRVHIITGNDPLERLIQMMKWGRIDAILEDESVFKYQAQRLGFNRYRVAGKDGTPVESNNLYIALSPNDLSLEYARMLSQGMNDLRHSGELDVILARYGLKDWK